MNHRQRFVTYCALAVLVYILIMPPVYEVYYYPKLNAAHTAHEMVTDGKRISPTQQAPFTNLFLATESPVVDWVVWGEYVGGLSLCYITLVYLLRSRDKED